MNAFHIENVEEWGRFLIDKYPLILTEFDPDVAYYFKGEDKDRVNLRYGWEMEKGWVLLLEELLANATRIVEKARQVDKSSFIHGFIAKSKYATLRWQGNSKLPDQLAEEWQDILDSIEQKSYATCETCGNPGKPDGTGFWLEVKCIECRKNG